jgi:ubiquinone/menaquinone biosynthesis C-methylase UbiE
MSMGPDHLPAPPDDNPADEQTAHLISEQCAYYDRYLPLGTPPSSARYEGAAELLLEAHSSEVQLVVSALRESTSGQQVLDVCCGTGKWPVSYYSRTYGLTLLDASPNRLQVCRDRFSHVPTIRYIQADIFGWSTEEQYDVVVMTFWLSHIPSTAWFRFWETLRSCLRSGGTVFFADHRPSSYVESPHDGPDPFVIRQVAEGKSYRVVKRLYEAADLSEALSSVGWSTEISHTRHFIYGTAWPALR